VGKKDDPDDLDEFIARRTALNPEFPKLMKAAIETRRLVRMLAAERERQGLSQKVVAAALGTKQPNVARLERGAVDPKHTTLVRYADLLGKRFELQTATSTKGKSSAKAALGSRGR
jgi:ribosome-binding protein aMBF1 (putative translation factor)